MRISDWSSDVCSSDLHALGVADLAIPLRLGHADHGGVAVLVTGAAIGRRDERPLEQRVAVPQAQHDLALAPGEPLQDRKSTRLKLQSLMRISYAVFCLKKKRQPDN